MMSKKKEILLIDTVPEALVTKLTSAGFICTDASGMDLDEVIWRSNDGITGLVIRSRFRLMADEIRQLGDIDFIARVGSGMENIDIKTAQEKGIRCINAPEGNSNAVAEHAMGMLLSLMHNIARSDRQVRNGKWIREGNRGHELEGRTVGIIGFGNTGSKFAAKLNCFDCEIITYDPYVRIGSTRFPFVEQTGLDDLLRRSDIISFHVPLNDETHMMVNDSFISRCREKFWLINTSRGKVVETASIVRALKSGRLAGAALDVLEYEQHSFESIGVSQLPDDLEYLVASDNCILTPHIAGWTMESNQKMAEILTEKILGTYD
jgi:D-3-phosphoglycerate dehydrogenase